MATSMCSRHRLGVRFSPPAPIFAILVMICLCGSAGAVSLSENTLYDMGSFDSWNGYSSSFTSFGWRDESDPLYNINHDRRLRLIVGVSSGSGGATTSSASNSYFDIFSPNFRFLHLSWLEKRNTDAVGIAIDGSRYVYVFTCRSGQTSSTCAEFYASPNSTTGEFTLSGGSGLNGTAYAFTYDVYQDSFHYDLYIAIKEGCYLTGLGCGGWPDSSIGSNDSWHLPASEFGFEVSNTKILPPTSSGGGGSVDLSGITSQINNLSSQMSASFQQVNANIDAEASSISQSIVAQTDAVNDKIDSAVSRQITANRLQHTLDRSHFDNWDSQLSGAFSSSDGQAVVDANSSVSGLHTFEENQIDDTESAIDDTGLSSYQLPSDYTTGLSEMGTIISLLFNSLGFVTPLIIFSCTLGIASVLVGRKSHEDG